MATAGTSSYKITDAASQALNALKDAAASAKLDTSNPFGFITDLSQIQGTLDNATNAAYDIQTKEANLGLNRAETSAYNNTQNAIQDLRNALSGSAASGGNVGAANASALQAILGLGTQNNELVTEQLNNIQNLAGERRASIMQNAADAISASNAARASQAQAATEMYNADQTRSAEALAGLASLGGTSDTNATNERMNNATNSTNASIANTTQKSQQTIINKKK